MSCAPADLVTRTSPFGYYATCEACGQVATSTYHASHRDAYYAAIAEHLSPAVTA